MAYRLREASSSHPPSFANERYLLHDLSMEHRITRIEEAIPALATKLDLQIEIKRTEDTLRSEIKQTEETLRSEIKQTEETLRSEIKQVSERVDALNAKVDALNTKVDNMNASVQVSLSKHFRQLVGTGILVMGVGVSVTTAIIGWMMPKTPAIIYAVPAQTDPAPVQQAAPIPDTQP